MGLFKDSLKVVNEIITLGGASRLEEAKQAYEQTYDGYLTLYEEAQGYKSDIECHLKAIGFALTQAKTYLEKAEKLIEPSLRDKSGLNIDLQTQALDKVARFNVGFNTAINVGAGSIAGGSLAVGSWGLVMAVGSASTGAAITGLSGVAATNATLAWFGGGALAAGGAGMAGGAAVLSGLFAIPLVYFAAKGSHKKAGEFEKAKIELTESIDRLSEQTVGLKATHSIVQDKSSAMSVLCESFISEVIRDYRVIRPYGIISALKQKIWTLMGRKPYTPAQVQQLEQLTQSVTRFLNSLGVTEESCG